jgi:hypothetical protein
MKLTTAVNGGAKCPDLSTEDKADSNVGPCPIDCELAGWTKGPERLESKTCGLGKQKMVCRVLVDAKHGGKKCAATKRDDKCNDDACPVDCVVGTWATKGTCSLTWGGGLQKNVSKITQDTENGGKICPALEEMVKCNVQRCPVDCKVSMWRDNDCDKTCGGGAMEMFRNTTIKPAFKGKACPAPPSNASCNADPCPVVCQMGTWTAYGNCTAECGQGKQIRTRVKKVSAAFGERGCNDKEAFSDSKACTTGPCPVTCVLGPWSDYGKCESDTDCGNVPKTRSRLKLVEDGDAAPNDGTPHSLLEAVELAASTVADFAKAAVSKYGKVVKDLRTRSKNHNTKALDPHTRLSLGKEGKLLCELLEESESDTGLWAAAERAVPDLRVPACCLTVFLACCLIFTQLMPLPHTCMESPSQKKDGHESVGGRGKRAKKGGKENNDGNREGKELEDHDKAASGSGGGSNDESLSAATDVLMCAHSGCQVPSSAFACTTCMVQLYCSEECEQLDKRAHWNDCASTKIAAAMGGAASRDEGMSALVLALLDTSNVDVPLWNAVVKASEDPNDRHVRISLSFLYTTHSHTHTHTHIHRNTRSSMQLQHYTLLSRVCLRRVYMHTVFAHFRFFVLSVHTLHSTNHPPVICHTAFVVVRRSIRHSLSGLSPTVLADYSGYCTACSRNCINTPICSKGGQNCSCFSAAWCARVCKFIACIHHS